MPKKAKSKFIIYQLVDPRDGTVRYVGSSKQGTARPCDVLRMKSCPTNPKLLDWVTGLREAGFKSKQCYEILEEFKTYEGLRLKERIWIRRHFISNFPLLNKNGSNHANESGYQRK